MNNAEKAIFTEKKTTCTPLHPFAPLYDIKELVLHKKTSSFTMIKGLVFYIVLGIQNLTIWHNGQNVTSKNGPRKESELKIVFYRSQLLCARCGFRLSAEAMSKVIPPEAIMTYKSTGARTNLPMPLKNTPDPNR